MNRLFVEDVLIQHAQPEQLDKGNRRYEQGFGAVLGLLMPYLFLSLIMTSEVYYN